MKTIFFILIVGFIVSSCRKNPNDEIIHEISSQSAANIIEENIDSIDFTFYLLNADGMPATVFKEGENFSFCFSVKNKLPQSIIATTEFINDDFFRIYRSIDNINMGRGWSGVWCEYNLGSKEIEYKPTKLKQLNCPWIISEKTMPDYPLCMSLKNVYLEKGEYYTSLHLDFHYTKNGIKMIINDRVFKINFKIE